VSQKHPVLQKQRARNKQTQSILKVVAKVRTFGRSWLMAVLIDGGAVDKEKTATAKDDDVRKPLARSNPSSSLTLPACTR